MATLNLEECHAAVLLDRAENEAAHRRQSKVDTRATAAVIALRGAWSTAALLSLKTAWSTAALLSLRGCNSVATTQWHLDPATVHKRSVRLVKEGLLAGTGVAEAVSKHGAKLVLEWREACAHGAKLGLEWREACAVADKAEVATQDLEERFAASEERRAAAEAAGEAGEEPEQTEEGEEPEEGEEDTPEEVEEAQRSRKRGLLWSPEKVEEAQVEEARAAATAALEARDELDAAMGGIEAALCLVVYGVPTVSC
ncbi:hypothetical protein T484DRAFT_1786183 [Baffinella frigidus]|nr:hypothetical protein T484DRAFT_1786183 [Cryptophyta sp. CCMP2293]